MNLLSQTSRRIYHVSIAANARPVAFSSHRFLSTSQLEKYLDILQVTRASTPREIKDSFLKLSKLYHPDNKVSGSHEKFVALKEAFDAVKDGAPSTTASSYQSQTSSSRPRYRNYDDFDLSHRTQAKYRERYKDYYDQGRPASAFGGPYANSSTPWEDLKRDREQKRQRAYRESFGQRPYVNSTVFLTAMAWILIYSTVILFWDYTDQFKRGIAKYRTKNYDDYQAYQEYLRSRNARNVAKLKRASLLDEGHEVMPTPMAPLSQSDNPVPTTPAPAPAPTPIL